MDYLSLCETVIPNPNSRLFLSYPYERVFQYQDCIYGLYEGQFHFMNPHSITRGVIRYDTLPSFFSSVGFSSDVEPSIVGLPQHLVKKAKSRRTHTRFVSLSDNSWYMEVRFTQVYCIEGWVDGDYLLWAKTTPHVDIEPFILKFQ